MSYKSLMFFRKDYGDGKAEYTYGTVSKPFAAWLPSFSFVLQIEALHFYIKAAWYFILPAVLTHGNIEMEL